MRYALIGVILAAMLAPQAGAQNRARQLAEHVMANQHKDDAALYEYERIEERISYKDGAIDSNEIYRLVPNGTGRLAMLLKRGDQTLDLATYQKQLRGWQDQLRQAIDDDPSYQQAQAKRIKRERQRTELIDAVSHAFNFKWLGEREEGGRTLAEIELDPNPSYRPDSRATDMLRHVRATAWIDEQAAQLVRARAEIISSITIAGGIVAKIYPGGWFRIEQSEAAPGLWFPAQVEYRIRGRVFLFSTHQHKLTKDWGYRRVGSPQQALELARKDLASNKLFPLGP